MTLKIYSIFWAVASVVTFFVYVIDKKRAIRGQWRIPEATLLWLSVLGGAWGGYLAMKVARHKTTKWYFHLVNALGAVGHFVLFMVLMQHPDCIF